MSDYNRLARVEAKNGERPTSVRTFRRNRKDSTTIAIASRIITRRDDPAMGCVPNLFQGDDNIELFAGAIRLR